VPVSFTAQRRRKRADYRRADWRPAYWNHADRCENSINYCQARRGVAEIDLIVIHIAEGSYSGTISWFKNRAAGVSAHYVVGSRGKVAQCVRNEDIAYHAGDWTYNKRSVGIEHAGYASNPRAFRGKYETSAKLSAYLSRRYNIPVDKDHFVLHRNVPGVNKTCPGYYFNYDKYLRLVRRYR
jgi:N-acetyl-anhydromuramyl-L-alanine amidase AmpD